MTKKEKSAKKIRPMLIVEIAFLVLLAIGAIICFNGMFKVWHIFTEKRIKTLEEIFDADFSDDTEFEYYSYIYQFQGGETHTLYIKNIANPESFCRSCMNMPIEFMADIKNAEAIEYGDYTEEAAENHIKKLSAEEINWRKKKRFADFLCICKSKGYQSVYLYFSKNTVGGYDVKIMM
ncbi:MAG: hypothetical protein K2K44_07535 [Oscillospiraceae bacterium]|nr:hypothetical protein [Oscillospiraceae bacterium]